MTTLWWTRLERNTNLSHLEHTTELQVSITDVREYRQQYRPTGYYFACLSVRCPSVVRQFYLRFACPVMWASSSLT